MHERSWSAEKAWIFKAFNTNVESLRKERTLGLKPCVSASLQEKKKKKSFEWLSESWELQRERHWLMQQKSWRIKLGMSVLGAGNAVVFSAYLIWVLLEQQHRKRWENTAVRMVCICQKAPRACYCRVSDNNCIQNVHSKTVNYLKCICNDKSAHKKRQTISRFLPTQRFLGCHLRSHCVFSAWDSFWFRCSAAWIWSFAFFYVKAHQKIFRS